MTTFSTVLPKDDVASAHAQRIIRELKEGGGYDDPGMFMVVSDQTGKTVHSIAF